MTAPAASDLARAVEALETALMYAEARERDGLPCAARLHPNHARTLLAALRSREQEVKALAEGAVLHESRLADGTVTAFEVSFRGWSASAIADAYGAAIRARRAAGEGGER